jgi:hypothetical protein
MNSSGMTKFANCTNMEVSYKSVSLPVTVMRMVKYTGYGNAAGFLAKRGSMLGGSGNLDSSSGAQYSSDSEDSDTEEYKKFKSQ